MKNYGKPSYNLTFEDAVKIWQMKWDGWLQSRIAALFDVNQGRISEILNENRFYGARSEASKRIGGAS